MKAQAFGRSRGGFGTKIHAVVDALGLPVRFDLGPGQQNDMVPACDLICGLYAKQVLADRAYDADKLHDIILDQGDEPVIPPRRHRKFQHAYDHIAYKQRWGIEAGGNHAMDQRINLSRQPNLCFESLSYSNNLNRK